MKLFLTLLLTAVSSLAAAQTQESTTILREGRTWKFATRSSEPMDSKGQQDFSVTVCGDTIVGGKPMKRLYVEYADSNYRYYTAAYEEDKRLYVCSTAFGDEGREPHLALDFNLHAGDEANGMSITAEDTIRVNGTERRRLTFGNISPTAYWVEGIGANNNLLCTPYDVHIGDVTYMLACYDNGTLTFGQEDFIAQPITNGISAVSGTPIRRKGTYDLSGHRLGNATPRGIYITDGVKRIGQPK